MNTETLVLQAHEAMLSLIRAGICPKCVLEGRGANPITLSIHTHDAFMGSTYLVSCQKQNPCGFEAVVG